MSLLQEVQTESIKAYVESARDFQRFAKQLFVSIGEEAKSRLSLRFEGVDYKYLLARLPHVVEKFEQVHGEAPLVGWVAMSFSPHEQSRVHIGTLLDYGNWPLTYTIGFHLMEEEYSSVKNEVHAIDWQQAVGQETAYQYEPANGEHMYNSRVQTLELTELTAAKERIVEQIVRYYETGAPIAAKIRS